MSAKKHKRGDVHPVTGLVYWDTWRGKERWRPASVVARWRKRSLECVKAWQRADISRHRACQKRLRDKHGKERNARCREYRNAWKMEKRRTDPLFAIKERCSNRVRVALGRSGFIKDFKTVSMIGCSIEFLKAHLESKWLPGMNWRNATYEGWHIDHITPLASAGTKQDVIRLFHYTNLQPLWWKDNLAKGAKMPAVAA